MKKILNGASVKYSFDTLQGKNPLKKSVGGERIVISSAQKYCQASLARC